MKQAGKKLTSEDTIGEARKELRENWEKGINCICCGQRVQLYNYKLFASSAIALIRLYSLTRENYGHKTYFHIKDYAEAGEGRPRAHHFAELRFWGLIEKSTENPDSAKKSSGYWKITEKGKNFVEGKLKVHSRILIFNNTFAGYAKNSELINIKDSLENKFDYTELMGYIQ